MFRQNNNLLRAYDVKKTDVCKSVDLQVYYSVTTGSVHVNRLFVGECLEVFMYMYLSCSILFCYYSLCEMCYKSS